MSKMDHLLISKREKQIIYDIYRACRLCGGGAGYKMPIIQTVVDADDTDAALKHKIRECVQIEVHQDDKMPPLICELCVDKVNDFYEFLDMCRQTNKRTRLRLGLPPQSMPRGAPDAEDCILGLTEPVYVNEDSDAEPLAKHKKQQMKVKVKKEPEVKVKIENRPPLNRLDRSSRCKTRRSPTPPRMTRHSKNAKEDKNSLSRNQDKTKSSKVAPVKSILKKPEESSLLSPRLKRTRDNREPVKTETPCKKVKIEIKPSSLPTQKSSPKTSPRVAKLAKSPKISPKRPPSPVRSFKCAVCEISAKTPQAISSHMRVHNVNFTNPKLACNPCGVWFPSPEEAASHHKHHKSRYKPYNCRRCSTNFKQLTAYENHLETNCIPWDEVPDVKCDVCWHLFPTQKLLDEHKCLGEDHRPGGKCSKCKRTYTLLKNLKKHENHCTAKKKGELIVDPVLLGKLKPLQVRVSRCDPLLTDIKQEHYDVSRVTANFGFDKNCVYPFSSRRIKSDPDRLDGMVAINDEIKHEFCNEDYVHWDSEDSESDDVSTLVLNTFAKKKVDSLSTLALKTIFSQRCLGRVPRKRRRVKAEKNVFDSLVADEDDVTKDINNIIDNLGDDDDLDDSQAEVNDDSMETNDNVEVSDQNAKNEEVMEKNDVKINDKIADVNGDSENVDEKSDDVKDNSTEINDKIKDGNNKVEDDSKTVSIVGDDSINYSVKKSEEIDAHNVVNSSEESNEECKDVTKKNDLNDSSRDVFEDVSTQDEKDINGSDGNVNYCKTTRDDNSGSNNDLSRINNTVKVNNGTINDNNNCLKSDNDSNIIEDHSKSEIVSRISNDENQNEGGVIDDELSSSISSKNDEKIDALLDSELDSKSVIENSQDSNSIGTFNENLLNDNTQSDVISETNDAVSEIEQNESVKANLSQDDVSLDNLSQESKNNDSDSSTQRNNKYSEDDRPQRDGNEVSMKESNFKSAISVIVNNDKRNMSDEIDDTKLMEDLDAQIGEGNDNTDIGKDKDHLNDKIALEDLLSEKNTEKSMDLDIIPDEFNFDT